METNNRNIACESNQTLAIGMVKPIRSPNSSLAKRAQEIQAKKNTENRIVFHTICNFQFAQVRTSEEHRF